MLKIIRVYPPDGDPKKKVFDRYHTDIVNLHGFSRVSHVLMALIFAFGAYTALDQYFAIHGSWLAFGVIAMVLAFDWLIVRSYRHFVRMSVHQFKDDVDDKLQSPALYLVLAVFVGAMGVAVDTIGSVNIWNRYFATAMPVSTEAINDRYRDDIKTADDRYEKAKAEVISFYDAQILTHSERYDAAIASEMDKEPYSPAVVAAIKKKKAQDRKIEGLIQSRSTALGNKEKIYVVEKNAARTLRDESLQAAAVAGVVATNDRWWGKFASLAVSIVLLLVTTLCLVRTAALEAEAGVVYRTDTRQSETISNPWELLAGRMLGNIPKFFYNIVMSNTTEEKFGTERKLSFSRWRAKWFGRDVPFIPPPITKAQENGKYVNGKKPEEAESKN